MWIINNYIPTEKNELGSWASKLARTVNRNVGKYNISNEDAILLQEIATEFASDLSSESRIINEKQMQVKKTQMQRKKLINMSHKIAQRIKANGDYTKAVGEEFNIIGSQHIFDTKTFRAKIRLRRVSTGVEISFFKSETEGVNIYRRVEGENDWRFLARDTYSPYVDTKQMDNHATYEYMAWVIIKDKEIGLESSTSVITV